MEKYLNEERVKKIDEIVQNKKLEEMLSNYIEQLYNRKMQQDKTEIDTTLYLNKLFYVELCNFPRITNRIKDTITICHNDRSLIYNLQSLYMRVAEYENLKDKNVMRRDITQFFHKYKPKYHLGKVYKYLSVPNANLISLYMESIMSYIDSSDDKKDMFFNPYTDKVNDIYNELFNTQNEVIEIIIKEAIEYSINNDKPISISEVISYISLKYNIDVEMKNVYLALLDNNFITQEEPEEFINEPFELICDRIFEKIYNETKKDNNKFVYKE